MSKRLSLLFSIWMLCYPGFLITDAIGDVTLEAELSRQRAFVGDTVTYQVLVRGDSDGVPPEINFPPTLRSEYLGASSHKFTTMRSNNGRQQAHTDSYYKHQYRLVVLSEGVVNIPEAIFTKDNKKYTSAPAVLEAVLPELSETDIIDVLIPDRPIYIGETVVAQVSWWIADQTQGSNFDSSIFSKSLRVEPISPRNAVGDEVTMSLHGTQFVARIEQANYKGTPMARLRFDLLITPTRTGNHSIGPMRVVFTRRDRLSRVTRMYAQSSINEIETTDVPTLGMPSDYHGLIGAYSARCDASNVQVNVGDPIELRLLVSGQQPMSGLIRSLPTNRLNSSGFRVSTEGWREIGLQNSSQRLFTTTVRATKDSVSEIPALNFITFNPDTAEFESFGSQPIPVAVKAVKTVTLGDAVLSDYQSQSSGDPKPSLNLSQSIFWSHPEPDEIRSSSRHFSLKMILSDPLWITAALLFGLLPIMSLVFVRIRNTSDPRVTQLKHSWKVARTKQSRGDFTGGLKVYTSAILDLEPESMAQFDLDLLTLDEELVARTNNCLSDHERAEYGTGNKVTNDPTLLADLRMNVYRISPYTVRKASRS